MKKVFLPTLAFLLMAFGLHFEGLTDTEREFAINELTKSQNLLNKTIQGLSAAQFNFKPDENSWSIAECLDHITISEDVIPTRLKGALEIPADPSRRAEVKFSDEDLLNIIKNREQKVKTSEPFKPSGKYGTIDETLEAFTAKRNAHIEYIKTTEDDLRNHYAESPVGTMDGLQILLFMSGHTERHVWQMKEIIAHEKFPEAVADIHID